MTLSSSTTKSQHVGNGSLLNFPTNFVFWDADDLLVVHTDGSGVDTIWVRGTQYTVTGGDGETGTVVVSDDPIVYTPQTGEQLTISSNLSDTQPTALPLGGGFPSPAVELRFDQVVRLIQQKAEQLGRSVKVRISSAKTDVVIPDPEDGRFLRGNATNDGFDNVDITGLGSVGLPVSLSQGGTNAIAAPAARTNLGLGTAAIEDAGTGANELVQLTAGAQYPAVDGSLITEILTAGKRGLMVPAAMWKPRAVDGCSDLLARQISAGQPDVVYRAFDTTVSEGATLWLPLPRSWDEGTIECQAVWTHQATTVNFGVVWDFAGVSVSDDDAIGQAFGTAQSAADTGGTTNDLYTSPWTSALTLAGTPAENDTAVIQISRNVADAGDTMAIDAELIGVRIRLTLTGGNDA